ncbi:short transient receptor potential channel 3-like isoform X2 [Ptychodera flava]|uniref:short transient receptor potential channel 3-like isoform X2 n=1 Tax=Ptychodera flava TaxID=63121 RepID=UPI00396A1BE2
MSQDLCEWATELFTLSPQELLIRKEEIYDGDRKFIQIIEDGNLHNVIAWLQVNAVNINVQVDIDGIKVTPLMVAAERNDFQIVRYLLSEGAEKLKEPTKSNCDTTAFGLSLLRIYRALCSPAYIVLTSDNPLLSAFRLSKKMRIIGQVRGVNSVNREAYLDLATRLEDFTVELLRLCKNSEQVLILLHGSGKSKTISWKRHGMVTALEALETEQKKFIGHPYTQHVLRAVWMSGQPEWSNKDGIAWQFIYFLFLFTVCGMLQPFLAIMHIFVPCSPLSGFIKSPKCRLVMYLFSYAIFLAAIALIATSENLRILDVVSNILPLWVAGLVFWEIEQAIHHGIRRYVNDPWNTFDVGVLLVFIINMPSIFFLLSSELNYLIGYLMEIAVSMYAICFTCAFLRALQFLYLQNNLGSMLLSFTQMMSDVFTFVCLFLVVAISFAAGLFTNYYGLYTNGRDDQGNAIPNKFGILHQNIMTLIWSIFGKEASEDLKAYGWVYSNGTVDREDSEDTFYMPEPTAVGNVLLVLFCFLTILILVNLCVAMMSDTFTRIQENIDIEWKFARTKIWMEFIRGPVLPAPYNLIPTFMCMKGIAKRLIGLTRRASGQQAGDTPQGPESCELNLQSRKLEEQLTYNELMRVLTVKYINKSLQSQIKESEESPENDTP